MKSKLRIWVSYGLSIWAFGSFCCSSSADSGQIADDPARMVAEALAFDADVSLKHRIRQDPKTYKKAVEEAAKKDLNPLAQVKLVEIGFFVLDEQSFYREANEALEFLRKGDPDNASTMQLTELVEKLVAAKSSNPHFAEDGDTSDSRPPPNADLNSDDDQRHAQPSLEPSAYTPSRSPTWVYILLPVVLVGILVVLVRSRKNKTRN